MGNYGVYMTSVKLHLIEFYLKNKLSDTILWKDYFNGENSKKAIVLLSVPGVCYCDIC